MRNLVSLLLAGIVIACAGSEGSRVTSPTSPLTYQQLAARPLKLPVVPAGQPCPANSITFRGGTAARIGTHVRLGFGGPGPHANYPWNKTVWDLPAASSLPNILLRGRRVDGEGQLYFDGDGNGPSDAVRMAVLDSRGGQTVFYAELRLPRDASVAFFTYPTTSGCYAIQADSDGFSEVIVFKTSG